MNDASQVIWREWATCEFDDHQYLSYLYDRVSDEQGGPTGSRVLGLAMMFLALFAFGPVVITINTISAVGRDADPAGTVLRSAIAVGVFGGGVCVAGHRLGAHTTWRRILRVLVILPIGLVCFSPLLPLYAGGWAGWAVVSTLIVAIGTAHHPDDEMLLAWCSTGLPLTFVILPPLGAMAAFCACGNSLGRWSMHVRRICFWWHRRPSRSELEQAVSVNDPGCVAVQQIRSTEVTKTTRGQIEEWVNALRFGDWTRRWVARHVCIQLAGLAVEPLTQHLRAIAHDKHKAKIYRSVLSSIQRETGDRFAGRAGLCATCLARITKQKYDRWSFFGCRHCGGILAAIVSDGRIVAVLSGQDAKNRDIMRIGSSLHLNWFAHPDGFDFDAVEVVAATDEQVERLLISMANETDSFRCRLYAKATCRMSSSCQLSTNTLRLLGKTFRRVEATPPRHGKSNS